MTSGMLSPGVHVGEGSIVTARAVPREGAQASANSEIVGNPAISRSKHNQNGCVMASWWKVHALSIVWGIFTLYLFFALNLVAQALLNNRLGNWRHSDVCCWAFMVLFAALLVLPINVAMKWLLIGRRVPGPFKESAWQVAADWVVDLHCKIFCMMVMVPWKSWWRFWNAIFRLRGSDIDWQSQVGSPCNLLPSKIDLTSIKRTHASSANVQFETNCGEKRLRTELKNFNVGALTVAGPGVNLVNAAVPPMEFISHDMNGRETQRPHKCSMMEEGASCLWNLLWMLLVLSSFCPAYEFSVWALGTLRPQWAAVSIAAALALHVISVIVMPVEFATFPSRALQSPWSIPLFDACLGASFAFQDSTFLTTTWGSPTWNAVARSLRASVAKRVLCFGSVLEGFAYHTVRDDTVVDGAGVVGHDAVADKHTLGEAEVSGVVHEGSFLFQGTSTKGASSGPCRCSIQSAQAAKLEEDLGLESSMDFDDPMMTV
jgi:hypothetical protein